MWDDFVLELLGVCKVKCLRKSGGIVTIFKKSLAHLLEFSDTSSEYVKWVKIDSSIFGTDKNVIRVF
jgi:hypothetical protein